MLAAYLCFALLQVPLSLPSGRWEAGDPIRVPPGRARVQMSQGLSRPPHPCIHDSPGHSLMWETETNRGLRSGCKANNSSFTTHKLSDSL